MSTTTPLWVIRIYSDRDNDKYEDMPFYEGKFLMAEAILAEEVAGLTWPQVVAGVGAWRVSALRVVIWLLRKRSNPKLKITEVVLNTGDITILDPDDMPEYGAITPEELEPEVALADSEPEAPKDQTSDGPGAPGTSTSPPLPISPPVDGTNDAGSS